MHKSFIQIKHQGLPPDIILSLGSNQPFSLLDLSIQATWVRCLMNLALRDLGHSLTVRWKARSLLALRYLANQRLKSCGCSICRFLVGVILRLSSGMLVHVLILKVRLGLPSAVSATVRSPQIDEVFNRKGRLSQQRYPISNTIATSSSCNNESNNSISTDNSMPINRICTSLPGLSSSNRRGY